MKSRRNRLGLAVAVLCGAVVIYCAWMGLGQRALVHKGNQISSGADASERDTAVASSQAPLGCAELGGASRSSAEGVEETVERPCLCKLQVSVPGLTASQLKSFSFTVQMGLQVSLKSDSQSGSKAGTGKVGFSERNERHFRWSELSKINRSETTAEVCLDGLLGSIQGMEQLGLNIVAIKIGGEHPLFRFPKVTLDLPELTESDAQRPLAVELTTVPLLVVRGKVRNAELLASGLRGRDTLDPREPVDIFLVGLSVNDGRAQVVDLGANYGAAGLAFQLKAKASRAIGAEYVVLVAQSYSRRPLTVLLHDRQGLVDLGDLFFPTPYGITGSLSSGALRLKAMRAVLVPDEDEPEWRLVSALRREGVDQELLWNGAGFELAQVSASVDEKGRFNLGKLGPFQYALYPEVNPSNPVYSASSFSWNFASSQAERSRLVVQAPQSDLLLPVGWAYVRLFMTRGGVGLSEEEHSKLGVTLSRAGKSAACPHAFNGKTMIELEPDAEYRVTVMDAEGSTSSQTFRSAGVSEFGEWQFDLPPLAE